MAELVLVGISSNDRGYNYEPFIVPLTYRRVPR